MTDRLATLVSDLAATQHALADVLRELAPEEWERPTASPRWTVRDQVRHLARGEELASLAATDPAAFAHELTALLADLDALERETIGPSDESHGELIDRWLDGAARVRSAVAAGPPRDRVNWITGPMSKASFLTARVMETFAHGHDIGDAVGRPIDDGRALAHVAHLGTATRSFSFANRGLPTPDTTIRVELTDPTVVLGPDDAPALVRGPARDFCLLVTRRVHRDDTALEASGPGAEQWLAIAQCFAGPPSDGPEAGSRPAG